MTPLVDFPHQHGGYENQYLAVMAVKNQPGHSVVDFSHQPGGWKYQLYFTMVSKNHPGLMVVAFSLQPGKENGYFP